MGWWPALRVSDETNRPRDRQAILLYACRPNPCGERGTISYLIPGWDRVRLHVCDAGGRLVRTRVDGQQPAGRRQVTWNGRDHQGRAVASGSHFLRLGLRDQQVAQALAFVR